MAIHLCTLAELLFVHLVGQIVVGTLGEPRPDEKVNLLNKDQDTSEMYPNHLFEPVAALRPPIFY